MSNLAKAQSVNYATVDFRTATVTAVENGTKRQTRYISHSAGEQMLVHAIALDRLGFQVHFQDPPQDLRQRIEKLELTIDFAEIINLLLNARIGK